MLSPYHLKHSGPLLREWLCLVFNTIVSLEQIPSSFKFGLLTPVYKGKGKDPQVRGSYRGISLSSVLAKTLEFVLLERIIPVLADENVPQLTQTGFQKGVSCSDAIFSCLETISKYIREGDSYSCFYDLASAFDTVEYPVLLNHLFRAGVVGKTWRLIKNWYSNSSSCVRISETFSRVFSINRGVKQGSVRSPVLFLLVMDPILLALKNKPCGLNICGLYLGAFCHADDIRTLASSKLDCSFHISGVKDFASSSGLTLSIEKCEAVISPSLRNASFSLVGGDTCIPVTNAARCLGAWWTPDLSCSTWIDSNIKKARSAFFARGKDLFLGKLNPLSAKSVIECCIMPVLMYGSESWILNSTLLSRLESFQAELGKRILRLHSSSSNRGCRIALHWPSMRARVLCSKFAFLLKLLQGDDSLSCQVFRSLAASEVESIQLVRQCRFLESYYGTNFTSDILSAPMSFSAASLKKDIINLDYSRVLDEASSAPHLKYIVEVDTSQVCSWPKIWDLALDRGPSGTSCVLAVLKLLGLQSFAGNCPFGSCELVGDHLGAHFLSAHTGLTMSLDDCVLALKNNSNEILSYGQALHDSFLCCSSM